MSDTFPNIPNYEFIRQIGEGGFGEVYLAKNTNNNFVAVKIIQAKNANREKSALCKYANLHNKTNIIKIIDSGTLDDAIYYVMPLADPLDDCKFQPEDFRWQEKSVAKLINQKIESSKNTWFSREEILSIIIPIFDAVIEIGNDGLLHRDIKPDNILFFNGTPTLSDLGLLENDHRSLSNLGTPMYLAPSWYINKSGNPDIYGIATTFYTLITGNLPDTIGRSVYKFPEKIKDCMSEQDRETWLHWHRCIMRAIAENPADRYLSLSDFKNAILSTDTRSSTTYTRTPISTKPKTTFLQILALSIGFCITVLLIIICGLLWRNYTIYTNQQQTQYISQNKVENEQTSQPKITKKAIAPYSKKVFENIKINGLTDESINFEILSKSQWLNQQNKEILYLENKLAQKQSIASKTNLEIKQEVNKKYTKDFDYWKTKEKQLVQQGTSQAEIEKQMIDFFTKLQPWIEADIHLKKDEIKYAKKSIPNITSAIALTKAQIDDPKYYNDYVANRYAKYTSLKK